MPNFMKSFDKINLEELQQIYNAIADQFNPEAYSKLFKAKERVSRHFPFENDQYKYIPVTESQGPLSEASLESYELDRKSEFLKKTLNQDHDYFDPSMSEFGYTEYADYITKEHKATLLKALNFKFSRVRFAILEPNATIQEHVDLPLESGLRIHIPLYTHQDCQFFVSRDGSRYSKHFPSDGHLYFLNTAFPHSVKNASTKTRVHLVVNCLDLDLLQKFQEI